MPGSIPTRIAMLSVHTSPLDQPGTGDAGGLNVYVAETAERLARRGTEVEIFTRATSSQDAAVTELAPGVLVRSVLAGPLEGLQKDELPGQLCTFAGDVLRVEAHQEPGWYDLVHSHYWLSGQVGRQVAARWRTPLVHTMHTMAKVKNAALAASDDPEPDLRVLGEQDVVSAADRLLANTEREASELVDLYLADPGRVAVVPPGVDLDMFTPVGRREARRRLGLDTVMAAQDQLVLFVGRLQPLKGPDVLVRAIGELLARQPRPAEGRRLHVVVLGGPSGTGRQERNDLPELIAALGLADVVSVHPPVPRAELADWYRAADLVAVPSHNESFGLVAIEAQACGTPVLAARVGGLTTAVADGLTGVLVDGHDPRDWAGELGRLLDRPAQLQRLGAAAVAHAASYGWEHTVDGLLDVYGSAIADRRREQVHRRRVLRRPQRSGDALAVAR